MTLATTVPFLRADPWGTLAPPAVPTGFRAAPQNTEVNLYWDENVYATGFRIYRNETLVFDGPHPTDDPVTGFPSPWTDTGLINGTTYAYTITAYNSTGESAPATANATPQAVVTDLTAVDVVAQFATLNWSVTTLSGFTPSAMEVRRDGQLIASLPATARTYTDTNVYIDGQARTARYTVVARNADASQEYLDMIYVSIPETVAPYAVASTTVQGNALSIAVPLPAGLKRYDLLIMNVARVGAAGASATPTGFTAAGYAQASVPAGFYQNSYYMYVGATPPTTTTVSFAAAAQTTITVVAYRGVDAVNMFSTAITPFCFIPTNQSPTGTTHHAFSAQHTNVPLRMGHLGPMGTWVVAQAVGLGASSTPTVTLSDSRTEMFSSTSAIVNSNIQAFQYGFRHNGTDDKSDVAQQFTTNVSGTAFNHGYWLGAPASPKPRTQASFAGSTGAATSTAGGAGNYYSGDTAIILCQFNSTVAGAVSLASNNATINALPKTLIIDQVAGGFRSVAWVVRMGTLGAAYSSTWTVTHPSASWRTIIPLNLSALPNPVVDAAIVTNGTNSANAQSTLLVKPNTIQYVMTNIELSPTNATPPYPYTTDGIDNLSVGTQSQGGHATYQFSTIGSGSTPSYGTILGSRAEYEGGSKVFSQPTNHTGPYTQMVISVDPGVTIPRGKVIVPVTTVPFAAFGVPL